MSTDVTVLRSKNSVLLIPGIMSSLVWCIQLVSWRPSPNVVLMKYSSVNPNCLSTDATARRVCRTREEEWRPKIIMFLFILFHWKIKESWISQYEKQSPLGNEKQRMNYCKTSGTYISNPITITFYYSNCSSRGSHQFSIFNFQWYHVTIIASKKSSFDVHRFL